MSDVTLGPIVILNLKNDSREAFDFEKKYLCLYLVMMNLGCNLKIKTII